MKNKKILFLSPYPLDKAPSQRLKYEQYYQHIERNGFTITTQSFVSLKFWNIIYQKGFLFQKIFYTIIGYFSRLLTLFSLRKYDIVYVHLWVTPFGFPIFEWLVRRFAKKIVYDIDDMVFLGHSSEANQLLKNLKGKNKMIYLMRVADHVITCTPTLDNFVRQFNEKTTDISSTIDTDKYQPKKHQEKTTITLGWSGSHSTSKYVKLLESVLETLLEKNYAFEVLVIGDAQFTFKNPGIKLKAIPWNLSSEVEDLKNIDIGLYPLPNEQWVLGKSGLKALQYMALGIPTIATNIGANSRIIQSGVNGFLVNNDEEWVNAITSIIDNVEKRNKMGERATQTVVEKFSIKSNTKTYLEVLNGVL
ncbi:MAG: glycosyltransferase family 4 protein [Flavobacteriales bacterium]|jgi:glycosyltransferase involved in cell wall biosynthesis|nr:glycosyltransferase family 4 protein [Flavobacteriales bacterium]